MLKATYGTGCFLLLNTGEQMIRSQNRLLSTIAYRIKKTTHYGLEGSIFNAGTVVKWLRDQLGVIQQASDTEHLANSVTDSAGVYFIPAFTGLGAPYWQPDVRAAIVGLTRDSSAAHIIRAALDSIAYQTRDVLMCMEKDSQQTITGLRVDGGMVANNYLLQFLADVLAKPVQRLLNNEATVLGCALLAGLGAGVYQSLDELAHLWQGGDSFPPDPSIAGDVLYAGWKKAVAKV